MMVRQAHHKWEQKSIKRTPPSGGKDVLQFFLELKSAPRLLSSESVESCGFEFCAEVGEALLRRLVWDSYTGQPSVDPMVLSYGFV